VKTLAAVAGQDYYYSFPVRKKNKETGEWEQDFIEGPSIKLANDLVREYGNCCVETMVVDAGDSWVIYAKFIDLERGFTMVRPFQQRKAQKALGTKDDARALDIALQIGVSKAIRNVIVNSLETFADFMFDEAKNGLIAQVKKKPDFYREKIGGRLKELSIDVKRVEVQVGRPLAEWRETDITKVIAQIKAVTDGMAYAHEIWPQSQEFISDDGAERVSEGETVVEEKPKDEPPAQDEKPVEVDEHMSEALANALAELTKISDVAAVEAFTTLAADVLKGDDFDKFKAAADAKSASLAAPAAAKKRR
jgi:hypothetical protein